MMPCSARYLVTIAAGMPVLANLPDHVQPRRDHRGLDRVEHVETRREIAEAVPAFVRAQHPVVAVADALVGQLLRPPHLEPPVLAEFGVDLAHGAAEIERFQDRFLDQRRAAGRLHHRRRHVARGDDRVLRRGRRVHQVGLVETVTVELALLAVLHQDLRGLRKARQQLVRRLRREDHRFLAARPVAADGVHAPVEIVERGMRQPRFVEMQRIDLAVEHLLDGVDVVDDAVVGALREGEHARLGRHLARERDGP